MVKSVLVNRATTEKSLLTDGKNGRGCGDNKGKPVTLQNLIKILKDDGDVKITSYHGKIG